jgi:cytoskeletal protein CcmA (bactofilin family)
MIFKREDEEEPQEYRPKERREEQPMADQQNAEVTIIGQGAKLDGTVVSAGSLRIDGQVKGQINADGDVGLSPQCQVEADIRAQNVSITAKTLVVEEGGIFHGQSIMEGQTPPGVAAPAGKAEETKADARPAEVKVP